MSSANTNTPVDDPGRSEQRRYYITTAIDYPNAAPHSGHGLEKVAADVVARYHRLQGDDTYFSMGLDENSQHVAKAAQTNNMDPQAWISRMDEAYRRAWTALNLSYDRWLRTTEPGHALASQEMFRCSQQHGDIYKAVYSGWYCPNCNTFYHEDELVDGKCPDHPTLEPKWLEEENYFFALSKYSDRLLEHIDKHPEFIAPPVWKAEVVGMLRQGLRDFPVSRQIRPGIGRWGVPVPGDESQVIYVWFDALTNYLTSAGFPDDPAKFARYWPADVHVIGKDITRFHCLYWPAMLLSAGLPLPRQIAVHGFMTIEGQRISKSTGNGIDPIALAEEFGVDAVRYYLLRNLSFASDGDFRREGLIRHYNSELANDLGNLLNRVVSMMKRYREGVIPVAGAEGEREANARRVAEETRQHVEAALTDWEPGNALGSIWNFVRSANQYIEQSEPWRLARQVDGEERLNTVLHTAAETLRLLSVFLAPFLPTAAERMRSQLGLEPISGAAWRCEGSWGSLPLAGVVVSGGPLLFPRIETQETRP